MGMGAMAPGSMPKPTEGAKAAFLELVPRDPAVTTRPMFGNLSAFVNGNMFAGLFGEDLFLRLPEADYASVVKQGGRDFAPMPGRLMTGYVLAPATWRKKPDAAIAWIKTSLAYVKKMPPKSSAKKAAPKKKAGKR